MHLQLRTQRGGALISALIAIVVMATMAIGLSGLTMTSNGVVVDTEDRMHALLMAEAGMAVAYKKIDPNTFEGLADDTVIHEESYGVNRTVRVVKSTNDAGRPTLVSSSLLDKKVIMGNITQVSRTIEGVIGFPSVVGTFPSGAFGMNNLNIIGNFFTDSYDSSTETYSAATADDMGNIGTNGPLTYNGSFVVNGNASPGPGQPPIVDSRITGSGLPLDAAFMVTVPPYRVPTGANTTFSTSLSGPSGATDTPAAYHFSSMSSSPNTDITFSGKVDIYVDGDIDLKGALKLADINTIVNIYQLSGTCTINGGGQLNTGVVITPATTITTPAVTENVPASSRTVAASSSNQSMPAYNASYESTPIPTYGPVDVTTATLVSPAIPAQGNPNSKNYVPAVPAVYTYTTSTVTQIVYWTISSPARTVVVSPETTLTIPAVTLDGGIPAHFNIISHTADAVKMNGNSVFYGTIIAPNAEVTLNGTADKFGAVLGKDMKLAGTGDFHNDTAARSPVFSRRPVLLAYREKYGNED